VVRSGVVELHLKYIKIERIWFSSVFIGIDVELIKFSVNLDYINHVVNSFSLSSV